MTAHKRDAVVAADASALRPQAREPAPPALASAAAQGIPTHDDIARRAYAIYQERGGADGLEADDWIRAERELTQRELPSSR
jgi:DUF2934 family protein